MDYLGNINLLRLKNAGVMKVKGKESIKLCIVIPIEDNDIYINKKEETGELTTANLSVAISQRREISKFGQTHSARLSFSQRFREAYPEDTKDAVYIGDFKEFAPRPASEVAAGNINTPTAEIVEDNDLPF